jgi:hypothetical protein
MTGEPQGQVMSSGLREDMVLMPTAWCVVRRQEQEVLIYNTRTDELHLIPPTGFYVYLLFDGKQTLGEVEVQAQEISTSDPEKVACRLRAFVDQLVERGILGEERGPTT